MISSLTLPDKYNELTVTAPSGIVICSSGGSGGSGSSGSGSGNNQNEFINTIQ